MLTIIVKANSCYIRQRTAAVRNTEAWEVSVCVTPCREKKRNHPLTGGK